MSEIKYLERPASVGKTAQKLLILIHGYGSNEGDLFSFADQLPANFHILSIRGTRNTPYGGFCWYDINFMNAQKFNDVAQAQESQAKILAFATQKAEELHLPIDDIWLCGFSQGAILSYAMAFHHSSHFKHIICLSGYPAQDILGEITSKNYSDLHFFVSHGKEDGVIPLEWAEKATSLLENQGVNFVFKTYNAGHGLVPQNFYDLLNWIDLNNK